MKGEKKIENNALEPDSASSELGQGMDTHAENNPFLQQQTWDEGKRTDKKYRALMFSALGVFLFLSITFALIKGISYYRNSSFAHDRVAVQFEGPSEASSTEPTEYRVVLENANRSNLKDVQLELSYSENFLPDTQENPDLTILSARSSKVSIGNMRGYETKEFFIKGTFYAPKDSTVFLRGKMSYKPGNSSSTYETESQKGISVLSSPILLEISAPSEASDGDVFDYVVKYENMDVRPIEDVAISVKYPTGYVFSSSSPSPSQDKNRWYLGSLGAGSKGEIRVTGSLSSGTSDGRIIEVELGKNSVDGSFITYSREEKKTLLVEAPIEIVQTVQGPKNNVIYQGEKITYSIKYKNKSNRLIRNAIVTAKLDSKVLDYSGLEVAGGTFNGSTNSIIWKASGVPGLTNIAPQSEGEVNFTVPVLETIPVESEDDKNYEILSAVIFDSPDIRTPSGEIKLIKTVPASIKLGTRILLSTQGFFNEGDSEGVGNMPMKVGEETQFVLHWKIVAISNDLENAIVSASLPPGVNWKEEVYSEGSGLQYNSRTNEIVWEAGNVKAGTGIITPAKEAVFIVSVIPQINQVGDPLTLIDESTLKAKDTFTGVEIETRTREKTTELTEDLLLERSDYVVYE